MKIFKKIYKWWYANVQLLNTILLILIITQLITYFDIKLINNTIIPIAYLISVFFVIRTFRENQNRNKMEIGKGIYEKNIKSIEDKLNEFIKDNNDINTFFPIEFSEVKVIPQQLTFLYHQVILLISKIALNPKYEDFLVLMCAKDIKLLENQNDTLQELLERCDKIHDLSEKILRLAGSLCFSYEDIYADKDFMSREQIKLALRHLDSYLISYTYLCCDIINKVNIYNIYYIRTVSRLEIEIATLEGTLPKKEGKVYSKLYRDDYLLRYHRINKIREELLS